MYFMKKIIEMDNNNNKNLEIKGINNYSCQDKKREVTWKERKKFFLKILFMGKLEYIFTTS